MLKNLFGGKKEKFYAQVDESKIVQASETPEAAAEPVAVVAEKAPEEKSQVVASKSKKTSVKKKSKTSAAPVAAVPTPAPTPKKVEPTQVTFASTSPISQTLERRLPGPSLGKFKEMARQVKTR